MEWAVWVEWECSLTYVKDFKKGCNFAAFFLATNKHALELSINPSLRTRRLLSAKVFPVDVISVIISEEPIKGYVSVAPRLGINLYWVTPFEIKKSLVKFGYLVATLNLVFLYDLISNDISSRSAIVCTSIQSSGTAITKFAFP